MTNPSRDDDVRGDMLDVEGEIQTFVLSINIQLVEIGFTFVAADPARMVPLCRRGC